jgi:hypothetical protein
MLKILGATIENLAAQATWCWGFFHYDILTYLREIKKSAHN